MLFNSFEYLLFLPIVFIVYWFISKNNFKAQNTVILISSYIFYGWWDWRFLSLILFSTVVDYIVGIKVFENTEVKKRKFYLLLSIITNLGLLCFFKYFNFFIESWTDLLMSFGYRGQSPWTLSVILPVGISFYTFQTMSYSLDIYNNKINPTKDFISFSSFVAFFPQLVAGPIERASNLLPQILNKRNFSYRQGVDGLRLILWGMFKKVVIADSLAPYVNDIFSNYHSFDGGTLLLGLLYFSFQIYCDFSGYSDIAIGTAKLFGFEIMSNFKFPYFSRSISEFWKRWHISLSSWFRDYLYIPLGGSRASKVTSIRNIVVIFVVSGFWHGASWTFIAWGLIHAILYIPVFISNRSKHTSDIVANNNALPSANEIFQMLVTFILVMIAWVFFRSDSVIDALKYLYIVAGSFAIPTSYRLGIIYIVPIVFLDWLWRFDERKPLKINNRYLRWALYYILLLLIFGHINSEQEFIYFQF